MWLCRPAFVFHTIHPSIHPIAVLRPLTLHSQPPPSPRTELKYQHPARRLSLSEESIPARSQARFVLCKHLSKQPKRSTTPPRVVPRKEKKMRYRSPVAGVLTLPFAMNKNQQTQEEEKRGEPCFAWVNVNVVKEGRVARAWHEKRALPQRCFLSGGGPCLLSDAWVKVALHLKSLARHGLACRDTFERGSAWAALLGWLVGSEWARSHGAVDNGWRCGHAIGSGRRGAILRWRAARLDGHLGKTCAWDNTLLAAVHLCAECLDIKLVHACKR
jgi:hypothetical protein